MAGFTDIHAHFVYGVDDGAQTLEQMQAMLDAAYEDHVRVLYATPHATPGLQPFNAQCVAQRLEEARAYCASMGYGMTLLMGAENLYTPALSAALAKDGLQTLGDSNEVLLEFVPDITCAELETALSQVTEAGYQVVVAHVERYDALYKGNRLAQIKRQYDAHLQVNCNTLLKSRGFLRDRKVRSWFEAGLIDHVASDAHDCEHRRTKLRAAYGALSRFVGRAEAARMLGYTTNGAMPR